ncbi:MAG TPA: hypothetical protein VEC93_05530, partial [Anaerolineae bacterium]|nr:hypothetical protein [Anaerolineae bacterium]
EGRFIFQKWAESLVVIRDTFHGRSGAPLGVTIGNKMINITFQRLIKQWMGAVTAAAYARPGLVRVS